MSHPITSSQQKVLDFVRSTIDRTGRPPTRAEIAKGLGFKSSNAAEDHLRALARKGVIELPGDGASRNIRLKFDASRNALIDAAPDMLEALREAEAGLCFAGADVEPVGDFVPSPTLALRIVRAAIAKAEGQS